MNLCDPTLGFEFPPPERVLLTRSILAAQAHIPVTEAVEMTGDFPHFGQPFEEAEESNPEVRAGIAFKVTDTPAYHALFEAAYPPTRTATR